jgi:hypothetical protein
MNSQRILQALLKTAQADILTKFLIELAKPTQVKIVFKKFPMLQKNKKYAMHRPTRHRISQ